MTADRTRAALAALAALALLLGACGGAKPGGTSSESNASGRAAATGTPSEATSPFRAVVVASELVVGRNRFALGVLDRATNTPIPDAAVHFRFFLLQGNQALPKFEADAAFRAPARDAGLAPSVQHRHPDGTLHLHANAEANIGVYTAPVTFDTAGSWGVQALVQAPDGRQGAVAVAFQVAAQPTAPAPGQPAPRSRQPTVRDVSDISQIDSSAEPDPRLHDLTIADAIASGKPTVVLFATPGYCSSQFCGPSVEILKKLMPKYAGRVNFIHVEVYKDFTKLTPSDTFTEWRLRSEPWFFVIDGQGIITDRFDGPTTLAELDAALAKLVP
jgi:hypothetical protein